MPKRSKFCREPWTSLADETEALFYTGRCFIEMGKFQEASRFLETVLQETPDYPDAMFYLGSAYGSLGRTSDACYTLGRYYYNRGDYKNAVVQLEKALESTADPDKKTEIEMLLKDAKKRHTMQGYVNPKRESVRP